MKDEEYYRRQIKGLMIILKDAPEEEIMIARSYILEKLRMILFNGINFHPSILDALEKANEN